MALRPTRRDPNYAVRAGRQIRRRVKCAGSSTTPEDPQHQHRQVVLPVNTAEN
eukprot:CAMPEP_0170312328 /NCGR_PEP_ID=MMETSP0116_2-20130129/56697_1 /TAXON_ID=400756 /ORGANISM="Durinskia baltica, Strain CSIRO CS-38" /LENGTH=52 /DNA_ID=CAMNT_0010564697 /DNA_START=57 /DNA_END=212 /DNA_ORIENTATION=-